jgi:hypothetical protein
MATPSDLRTADQLIYEAAAILGKAVAGEALGQPEYQTLNTNVDDVLAEVATIVFIADRDEIPERYFMTLARMLAIHAAAKFSNQPVAFDQLFLHEQRLRFLAATPPTYETLRVNYF